MSPLLTALLCGLRANCEATICAIDLYLAMTRTTDEPKPNVEPPQPPPAPPALSENPPELPLEGCQHLNRIHAPVMGNQGRFICRDCNQEFTL